MSALLIAEFAVIDLYARLGMANWKLDASLAGFGSESDDGWEPTYGVGIGAHFGSIGVRAEYETFQVRRLRLRRQHGFAERHLHVSVASARQVAS